MLIMLSYEKAAMLINCFCTISYKLISLWPFLGHSKWDNKQATFIKINCKKIHLQKRSSFISVNINTSPKTMRHDFKNDWFFLIGFKRNQLTQAIIMQYRIYTFQHTLSTYAHTDMHTFSRNTDTNPPPRRRDTAAHTHKDTDTYIPPPQWQACTHPPPPAETQILPPPHRDPPLQDTDTFSRNRLFSVTIRLW